MVQRRSRLKDRLNGEMSQQIGALSNLQLIPSLEEV